MQKINLSNDTAERLAGLRASDSPFANTIAAALDNVAIGLTPESSLASAIEAAADLDSNAALARTALHGRTEFLAKLAESAANISGSMNGRNMAESDIPAARGLAGELERLAFGLADYIRGALSDRRARYRSDSYRGGGVARAPLCGRLPGAL